MYFFILSPHCELHLFCFAFFPPVLLNHLCVFDWWTTLPKKVSRKQCPDPLRPRELSFGMLKDSYLMSFCHKVKPSMLLIAFRCSRSCIFGFETNVQGRKYCPATWQHTAPHCSSVNGEVSEEQLGNFCPTHPTIHIHKWSDARPALCNQWGNPGNILFFLWAAEVDFYGKGIFRLIGKNTLIGMGIS